MSLIRTTSPDFCITAVILHTEGREPVTYDRTGASVGDLELEIPENTRYHITYKFKVSNRTLKDLRYTQVVKTLGVTVKTREMTFGAEYQPSETEYTKDGEEDVTPGGIMLRGLYQASSTYYAGDEELFTAPWTLTITKK